MSVPSVWRKWMFYSLLLEETGWEIMCPVIGCTRWSHSQTDPSYCFSNWSLFCRCKPVRTSHHKDLASKSHKYPHPVYLLAKTIMTTTKNLPVNLKESTCFEPTMRIHQIPCVNRTNHSTMKWIHLQFNLFWLDSRSSRVTLLALSFYCPPFSGGFPTACKTINNT